MPLLWSASGGLFHRHFRPGPEGQVLGVDLRPIGPADRGPEPPRAALQEGVARGPPPVRTLHEMSRVDEPAPPEGVHLEMARPAVHHDVGPLDVLAGQGFDVVDQEDDLVLDHLDGRLRNPARRGQGIVGLGDPDDDPPQPGDLVLAEEGPRVGLRVPDRLGDEMGDIGEEIRIGILRAPLEKASPEGDELVDVRVVAPEVEDLVDFDLILKAPDEVQEPGEIAVGIAHDPYLHDSGMLP